jgi:hypothetical protein
MTALGFTDSQMAKIEATAMPLDRFVRAAFIASVGEYFHGRSEVGDGELHRCLVELQREFLYPPRRTGGARGGHNGRP